MHLKLSFGNREIKIERESFENGQIIVVYEGKRQLGTIAFGIPSPTSQDVIITQIYGSVNELTARALVEYLAQKHKLITILSIFLSSKDDDPVILRALLDKFRKM
ncbi:MAG: hypothetical protein ACFFDT_11680 [Candidatus Hodarchaeota archaeon]